MMPSALSLADLCAEAYAAFDKPTWCVDAVRAFRYAYPDFTAIIFPGSVTPLDWARDFLALDFHPEIEHADLGVVPLGFWLGLETVLAQILAEVGDKPLVLAGHSLGGARALLAAGLLAAQNRPPAHVAAFAPPKGRQPQGAAQRASLRRVSLPRRPGATGAVQLPARARPRAARAADARTRRLGGSPSGELSGRGAGSRLTRGI